MAAADSAAWASFWRLASACSGPRLGLGRRGGGRLGVVAAGAVGLGSGISTDPAQAIATGA